MMVRLSASSTTVQDNKHGHFKFQCDRIVKDTTRSRCIATELPRPSSTFHLPTSLLKTHAPIAYDQHCYSHITYLPHYCYISSSQHTTSHLPGPESIMIFPPKDPLASALPPQRSSETTPPLTINHGKSPPSINDNADAAPLLSFIPTGPRTPNPFTNNLNWQTLGFENPHSFPKRDASFVPVGGREGETPTPPTMTSKQYVASVEAAWQGSEVFDARHELLVEGKSVFNAQVDERRRETCLLGYGKADVKPLKLGGEFGALGWHAKGASAGDGNPGSGRGRGHGRFNTNLSSLLER